MPPTSFTAFRSKYECCDDSCSILLCLCSQAYDLPESQNHGSFLGYDRQDLYLSVGLQTVHGREHEKSTRVQEGQDGTVKWYDETISIKYSNGRDELYAEVSSTFERHVHTLPLGSTYVPGENAGTMRLLWI